jgi:hypothetical protein
MTLPTVKYSLSFTSLCERLNFGVNINAGRDLRRSGQNYGDRKRRAKVSLSLSPLETTDTRQKDYFFTLFLVFLQMTNHEELFVLGSLSSETLHSTSTSLTQHR